MAKCPNCGNHLTVFNVSQFCPHCKVNMRFCNFEENFLREAKNAELSQAVIHCKIRNLRTAFVGSYLTIARLVVMLLPIVSLLLPAVNAEITLPFKNLSFSLSGLGIYQFFSDGTLNFLLEMCSSTISGEAFAALKVAVFSYAITAVLAVLVLLTSILCFISIKNMQKITTVISAIGMFSCVFDYFIFKNFITLSALSPTISAKFAYGLIITEIMFAIVFAINLILSVRGIPVKYDEGALERREIYEKVKKGEISLDDLPQPVIETAETRKIDEEIAKEEANLEKIKAKEREENADNGKEKD